MTRQAATVVSAAILGAMALGPGATVAAAGTSCPTSDHDIAAALKAGRLVQTGTPIPVAERPYALRMYGIGPYKKPVMNLFFALGATAVHFEKKKDRDGTTAAIALLGRSGVADQIAASFAKHPAKLAGCGVRPRDAADAMVRGMVAGI